MYVYKITNKINKKAYIGITNNYKTRMSNHKCGTAQVIDKAIQKYGADNFDWEILLQDLSVEEAKQKEQEYILFYKTHAPYGYNISWGGDYQNPKDNHLDIVGLKNPNARLTKDEVEFIKNNRNLPSILLYQYFCDFYEENTYSYEAFLKVYHNQTYKDVPAPVAEYPYNANFSNHIRNTQFSIEEILHLRKQYIQLVPWEEAYKPYKDRMRWDSFWQIYNGYGAKGKMFMPEIFTPERKKQHTKLKGRKYIGEKNPTAKLTEKDVIEMRAAYDSGTSFQELYNRYPNVTKTTVRQVCYRQTWKHLK